MSRWLRYPMAVFVVAGSLSSCGSVGEAFQEGYQAGYHFAHGENCYKAGNDSEAVKEYKTAIEAAEKCKSWIVKSRALVRLGQISAKQGNTGEADADFKTAIDLFDRNSDSPSIKKNYRNIKSYWITALHGRSEILQKQPINKAEAQVLEQKAKSLESNSD